MANIYTFSLQQAVIAAYTGSVSYGTPRTLESTKTLTIGQKLITDQAQGNSKITDLETQSISDDVKLDTAGLDFAALAILTGQAASASGSNTILSMPNAMYPYFGIVAEAWYGTISSMLLFFPYCKITSDFSWAFDFGKIVVPKFACMAIQEPTLGYMWRLYDRPSVRGSIAFPPNA